MARPTKLTNELVEKAARYVEETKMGGLDFGDLPTEVGLCLYIGIARSTLHAWSKLDTPLGREFSSTLETISQTQQYQLVGKALKGEYNPTIAKMLLNVNHGMVEKSKSETDITSGGKPVQALVEFVDPSGEINKAS